MAVNPLAEVFAGIIFPVEGLHIHGQVQNQVIPADAPDFRRGKGCLAKALQEGLGPGMPAEAVVHEALAPQGPLPVDDAGDGIAHAGVSHALDGGSDITHLAGAQSILGHQALGAHVANLHYLIDCPGSHHFNIHTGPDGALLDAGVDNNAPVAVVYAVEDQCLQRCFTVTPQALVI